MTTEPIIECRAAAPFMKNGYILACPETRQALYVDPGDEAEQLLLWLAENRLELAAIANTHGHLDHISGISIVKQALEVPIYLHPEDEMLYNLLSQQAGWFGLNYPSAPKVDHYYRDGDELRVGNLVVQVLHTPGHSPGSVCLAVGNHVFCGDLIFAGSVGRTDLPGGSHPTLIGSINEKLLPLGDEKILHCGHGPDTTIGAERRTNPFLM